MAIEASYEAVLSEAIDTTTGSKTFIVSTPLTNADGVLKVGIGLDTEEWFEVTGVDVGNKTITTTLRGLSLTDTDTLTESASNRKEHFPGEKIAIVTFPNVLHTQNTDTGTTSTTFDINSGGSKLTLDSTGLTTNRTITFNDADTVVVGEANTQTLTNKTLTDPVFNGTLSGTAFLDEDDMVSDSAIAVASQQSIKAFVNAQVTSPPSGTTFINAILNGTISGTAITTTLGNPGVDTLLATEKAIRSAIVASVAGVADINAETGSITLVGGTNLTLTNSPAGTFTFDVDAVDVILQSQIFS